MPAARAASSAEAAASALAASQGCSALADPNTFTAADAADLARFSNRRVSRKKAHSMLKLLREELDRTGEHSKDLTDGDRFSWKGYVAAHPDCHHFIGPGCVCRWGSSSFTALQHQVCWHRTLGCRTCEGGEGASSGLQAVGAEVTEACFRAYPMVIEALFVVFTYVGELNIDTSIAPLSE